MSRRVSELLMPSMMCLCGRPASGLYGPLDFGEDFRGGLAVATGKCPPQNLLDGCVGIDVCGVEVRDSLVQTVSMYSIAVSVSTGEP